jgi:hypothetical protein
MNRESIGMMKNNYYTIIYVMIISFYGFAQDATDIDQQESVEFNYGFENDFITQYIWRGLSYNEGFITQPYIWVEYNGFTFYSWSSLTLQDRYNNPKNNEVDFAIQYSKKIESLLIEPSISYYTYPNQVESPSTAEANIKLAYQVFDFEFFTNFCLDVLEYPGSLSGDIGTSKILFENDLINISIAANTGWANKKFIETYIGEYTEDEVFHFLNLSLAMEYYLTDNIYIRPHIEYYNIMSTILKTVSGDNLTNFGLAIGVTI